MTRLLRLFFLLVLLAASPAWAAYTDNADGTVTDTATGLMWDKYSWGQTGNTDCAGGGATTQTWAQALAVAVTANAMNSGAGYKGYTDWRLPNVNELESLVKIDVSSPAIDAAAFPNTVSSWYWSSTIYAPYPANAWSVYFVDGYANANGQPNVLYVRLVRSGQLFDSFDSLAADTTPDAFSFTDQTGVALSAQITSAPVQITGINAASSWTASNGTACVSSGNDCSCDVAGFGASGQIGNNQYLCARHTSSASYSTATDTVVTVGGVGDTFSSTTLAADTTPDAFSFTAQTGVALSSTATSNGITVSGINTASAISITGGTYAINGGGYTSATGTVGNGDTVTVRQTSSASFSTLTTATLSIGGVSGGFDVTTLADTSYTAPSPGGSPITASISGGGTGCGYTAHQFIAATGTPAGVSFPQGLFDFTASGCTPDSTITLTITYPQALPAGTQYWKYGPTSGNTSPHWYTIPAAISGNTVTFTITDGGLGDDDLTANGVIVDQGGPGFGAVTGIPTLNEWGMMLLSVLLGLGAVFGLRRSRL